MIRVWIELLPGGEFDTGARWLVFQTSKRASDFFRMDAWEAEILEMSRREEGTICGHTRSRGALELIRRLMVEAGGTEPRGSVSDEERIVDLSSHLLMLVMALDSQNVTPHVEAIVDKAREALKRSAK